jgi:hypothetical protein
VCPHWPLSLFETTRGGGQAQELFDSRHAFLQLCQLSENHYQFELVMIAYQLEWCCVICINGDSAEGNPILGGRGER